VVLAIGVGALKTLCADLAAVDSHFDDMTQKIQTVPTQSLQLWLGTPLNLLSPKTNVMFISGPRPFNSWVDMTPNLSGRETWPPSGPDAVVYFCDEFVDMVGFTPDQAVASYATDFLQNDLAGIWPSFTWNDLHDPSGAFGPARLASQYLRANVDPSDRAAAFAHALEDPMALGIFYKNERATMADQLQALKDNAEPTTPDALLDSYALDVKVAR